MNLKHLGDAFDHWKGSVIKRIGSRSLQVLPMFTDKKKWTPRQLSTYAKLLHRKPSDILKQKEPYSKESRSGYFNDLGNEDLFLDPDTGIAPKKGANEKHVRPSELSRLLKDSGSRVLLIYQHSSRYKNGFSIKLGLLRESQNLKGYSMFAYDAGAVSMVVISRSQKRIAAAQSRLLSWLGPVARARIIR